MFSVFTSIVYGKDREERPSTTVSAVLGDPPPLVVVSHVVQVPVVRRGVERNVDHKVVAVPDRTGRTRVRGTRRGAGPAVDGRVKAGLALVLALAQHHQAVVVLRSGRRRPRRRDARLDRERDRRGQDSQRGQLAFAVQAQHHVTFRLVHVVLALGAVDRAVGTLHR